MKNQFKPDGCDARIEERDTVTDMADAMDRFFEMLDSRRSKIVPKLKPEKVEDEPE